MALAPNGTVQAWGSNVYGQTNVPPEFIRSLSPNDKAVAIAAGYDHCIALKTNGWVEVWGASNVTTRVPFFLNNVVAIAGGGGHGSFCLALKANGTVVAWGINSYDFGQTNVPAGLTNVVAIAAGDTHSLVLKSDGTLVAWGSGPTNIPAGLSNVVAVSAGQNHNLVLKDNGTVYAWGENFYGQTNVPANLTNVWAIASGRWHCLALKSDGTVSAWGMYHDGAHYQNMTVPSGLTNVIAIEAGEWTSMALLRGSSTVIMSAPNLSRIGTNLCLSISSQCSRVYRLEYKDSLTNANWVATPLVAGNGRNIIFTDSSPTNSQRFYRIRGW